jgi:RNA polymerase sigma-70 factor, ECF subfamily
MRQAPADELVAQVYTELRRLADHYVRRERAQSVQATDLVHEAYLRLKKEKRPAWTNRTHFLAIAAISMRRLLVERARARGASKRGGGQIQVTLDERLIMAPAPDQQVDLLALDRALESLAELDPQQARIVELRFFGGLSIEETARVLASSTASVTRGWRVARMWLVRELEGADN